MGRPEGPAIRGGPASHLTVRRSSAPWNPTTCYCRMRFSAEMSVIRECYRPACCPFDHLARLRSMTLRAPLWFILHRATARLTS